MKLQHKTMLSSIARHRWLAGSAVIVIVLLLVLIPHFAVHRSVAQYCKAYEQEQAKLSSSTGTTYSTKVFDHASSNPQDFVVAFSNLDRVAPKGIEPDVSTLRQVFLTIQAHPDQTMSASLNGLSAEANVTNWTHDHCYNQ